MSKLTWRTLTYDIVLNIKTYIINELLPEFSTWLFGDLWLSVTKLSHMRELLISILVDLLKKISAERIPDRSSKNSCILKDVAFISDKAALEHLLKPSLSSWLALGIGSYWYSQVYGSTWYVLQHWTLLDYHLEMGYIWP